MNVWKILLLHCQFMLNFVWTKYLSVAVLLESRNLNCWNSQEPWPFKKAIYHRYFSTALTQSFFEYVCLLFCSFFPFNLFLFILFKYPLLLSISFSLPKWCVMNHKTLPFKRTSPVPQLTHTHTIPISFVSVYGDKAIKKVSKLEHTHTHNLLNV